MTKHLKRKRYNNRKKFFIVFSVIFLLFVMSTMYAAFQTNLNLNAKGNIVEKNRVIKSWLSSSNEDFHTDFYRENVISITFLDTNKVPDNAVESWDVSETQDGGVYAYVIQSISETGKYDLFIGANRGVVANKNSSYLFQKFKNVISIEFNNNFDTSNVTTMYAMFNQCSSLKYLNVSSFDTSNVNNMSIMFMGCNSLTELDLSSFNTSNVVSMSAMFSGWSDSGNHETKLKILNLTGFNTGKVTTMHDMFVYNNNLITIKGIESFDTSSVTIMDNMFASCAGLVELNLCSFDTKKVTHMAGIFKNMKNISKIFVGPNWTTGNATTNNMWDGSKISTVTAGQC